MYPENKEVNAHWGALAVRHLWSLASLDGVAGDVTGPGPRRPGGPGHGRRRRGPDEGAAGAGAAASLADAYAAARAPQAPGATPAPAWRRRSTCPTPSPGCARGGTGSTTAPPSATGPPCCWPWGRCGRRPGGERGHPPAQRGGAALFHGGLSRRHRALRRAPQGRDPGRHGTAEGQRAGDGGPGGRPSLGPGGDPRGRVGRGARRGVPHPEEDWTRFSADLPLRIGFRGTDGARTGHLRMGDRVDLQVELPKGYQAGDLVHVALPASLSWIEGGGRVKRFTRDFEGKSSLSVPLVVTGELSGKQHFAVCVRNMFEEERAGQPGPPLLAPDRRAQGWRRTLPKLCGPSRRAPRPRGRTGSGCRPGDPGGRAPVHADQGQDLLEPSAQEVLLAEGGPGSPRSPHGSRS